MLLIDCRVPVATFLARAMFWQLSPLCTVYVKPDKHVEGPEEFAIIGLERLATGGLTSVGKVIPHAIPKSGLVVLYPGAILNCTCLYGHKVVHMQRTVIGVRRALSLPHKTKYTRTTLLC